MIETAKVDIPLSGVFYGAHARHLFRRLVMLSLPTLIIVSDSHNHAFFLETEVITAAKVVGCLILL